MLDFSEIPIVILAGGRGTRIQHLLNDLPKPMYPIFGRPFLDYQIAYLKKFGFQKFYISTGYQAQFIEEYYSNTENIRLIHENEPLGTGGGILHVSKHIQSPNYIVLNGDTLYLLDYKNFVIESLKNSQNTTIALNKVVNVERYGSVEIEKDNIIKGFKEKSKENVGEGLINAGIYFVNKSQIENLNAPLKCSMELDIFPELIKLGLYGFKTTAPFIDIGTPETLSQIEEFIKEHQLEIS
jgi:D-glycero-alpha-D-manno-heptose 1-phosphate guanylyltransferase